MKKKWIGLFVGVLVLCICAFAGAEILGGTTATRFGGCDNVLWEFNTSTGALRIYGTGGFASYYKDMGPAWVDEGGVSRSSIRTLVIEEGVTSIPYDVFSDNVNMISVQIAESVTSIGSGCFANCASLRTINLPKGLTAIENKTFENCTALSSIEIPAGVTRIGERAFKNTPALRSITTYGDLEYEAFSGSGLTSLTVNNCITVGQKAFFECSSLATVTLCDTIRTLEKQAFDRNSSLRSINMPAQLETIGDNCFGQNKMLSKVELPSGLLSIGSRAFGETALTEITIPDTVYVLGNEAFAECASLRSAKLSAEVSKVPVGLFYKCSMLNTVTMPQGQLVQIEKNAFRLCSALASVVIPEGVTQIGEDAFKDCFALQSVSIPDTVTTILEEAFHNCEALAEVVLPNRLTSLAGWVFQESGLKCVTIPVSMTSIGKGAFADCRDLTDVFYLNSSRDGIAIGDSNGKLENAFWHYGEVKDPGLTPGQLWTVTYAWAADHSTVTGTAVCKNHSAHTETETVKASERVIEKPKCETPGENEYTSENFEKKILFTKQTVKVEVPATGHDWGEPEYSWTDDWTEVTAVRVCKNDRDHKETETVKTTVTKVQPTQSAMGKNVYTATFQNPAFKEQKKEEEFFNTTFTVKGIKYAMHALRSTANLEPGEYDVYVAGASSKTAASVTIPKTVKMYGISFKVTAIKAKAFRGMKKLASVSIGANVTSIGDNAFENCTALKKVTGGAGVVTIGKNAFKKCTALTAVTLESKVKNIGASAFYGCKKLKTITIKTKKLTKSTVGSKAFTGIASKPTVKCPKGMAKTYKKWLGSKGMPKNAIYK